MEKATVMTLKEQTQDLHEIAEKNTFAQMLLGGKLNEQQYGTYLANLWLIYSVLEKIAEENGALKGIEDIKRSDAIRADLLELNVKDQVIVPATYMYITHLDNEFANNKRPGILAHIYVRHFGDLYGGQIVKKMVPGSGMMYEFPDRAGLIEKTRSMLTEDLGPEARMGFEFAIALFEDLVNELNL